MREHLDEGIEVLPGGRTLGSLFSVDVQTNPYSTNYTNSRKSGTVGSLLYH